MDCVSPIFQIATDLFDCTANNSFSIRSLQQNIDSLRHSLEVLQNLAEDVRTKKERAEEQGEMRRKDEVDDWLHSVEVIVEEIVEVLRKGDQEIQKKCPGTCCPMNCLSSYKIGKLVNKKLSAVIELQNKRNFIAVPDRLPQAPLDERPMKTTVGLGRMCEVVCSMIKEENTGCIGLVGMGGAGKTTLMTKVHDEYIKTSKTFDVAIWISMGPIASVKRIQEVILQKLEIPHYKWRDRSEGEKAEQIFNVLKKKCFVLLLDDLWVNVDLRTLGVPSPSNINRSKVILSSRNQTLADYMGAKTIHVQVLSPVEAFSLFETMVGEETLNLHPDIPDLARELAELCKGLPLALVTLGRAMVRKNDIREWQCAKREMLSRRPDEFDWMSPVLEFSYDNLQSDVIKSCFRYFSLFSSEHEILNDDLIDLWIGEGFLEEFNHSYGARDQGNDIIKTLKFACLLETGSSEYHVKMHDVICDMTIQLSRFRGNVENFPQRDGLGGSMPEIPEARRVSWWTCHAEELSEPPRSRYLSTLIVKDEELKAFPQGFFLLMRVQKVLDLSGTPSITHLPVGIDKLETLEYLNLSNTQIRELPMELNNLAKMRCLILNDMLYLQIIPLQVISSFPLLQIFSLSWVNLSSLDIMEANYLLEGNKTLLEKLECLEKVAEVSIPITSALSFQKFLGSQKLQRTIRWLSLEIMEGVTLLQLSFLSLQRMTRLEKLAVRKCLQLKEIQVVEMVEKRRKEKGRKGSLPHYISNSSRFHRLCHVVISVLPKLLDMTWLIYAQELERLEIFHCASMEKVIRDDCGVPEGMYIFSRVKYLRFDFLPSLRSIYGQALQFPSLREIHVRHCISLRKLPFDSNTATNSLQLIRGSSRWWDGLQWDNESLKHAFTSYFVPQLD